MDTLIRQIAQSINSAEPTEALGKALQTVAYSGLGRNGFFKECFYLPELDHRVSHNFFVCFLHDSSDRNFDADQYYAGLCDELKALGVRADIGKTKSGYKISLLSEEDEEQITLEIFVYHKAVKFIEKKISYIQTPLPYELRSAVNLKPQLISEVQKAFEKNMKAANAALKKKKAPKKSPDEKKKAEPPKEKWVQPSLF